MQRRTRAVTSSHVSAATLGLATMLACSGGAPVGGTVSTSQPTSAETFDDGTTADDGMTSSVPTSTTPDPTSAEDTAKETSESSAPGDSSESSGATTGEPTSASSGESSTTADVETGSGGPSCGNGVIDEGENCDGDELGAAACSNIGGGFTGGTLTCAGDCAFDTTECLTAANPTVQCHVANLAIPDDGAVMDNLALPAELVGRTISDVDVSVELDHTYVGDLVISVSSGGIEVSVFDACTGSDNLDVSFDDEADAAINCASTDSGAIVTPLSPLSGFDGDDLAASWTLEVADAVAEDTGTLTQWCVTVVWQ